MKSPKKMSFWVSIVMVIAVLCLATPVFSQVSSSKSKMFLPIVSFPGDGKASSGDQTFRIFDESEMVVPDPEMMKDVEELTPEQIEKLDQIRKESVPGEVVEITGPKTRGSTIKVAGEILKLPDDVEVSLYVTQMLCPPPLECLPVPGYVLYDVDDNAKIALSEVTGQTGFVDSIDTAEDFQDKNDHAAQVFDWIPTFVTGDTQAASTSAWRHPYVDTEAGQLSWTSQYDHRTYGKAYQFAGWYDGDIPSWATKRFKYFISGAGSGTPQVVDAEQAFNWWNSTSNLPYTLRQATQVTDPLQANLLIWTTLPCGYNPSAPACFGVDSVYTFVQGNCGSFCTHAYWETGQVYVKPETPTYKYYTAAPGILTRRSLYSHEIGHVFGLNEQYNTDNSCNGTYTSIMDNATLTIVGGVTWVGHCDGLILPNASDKTNWTNYHMSGVYSLRSLNYFGSSDEVLAVLNDTVWNDESTIIQWQWSPVNTFTTCAGGSQCYNDAIVYGNGSHYDVTSTNRWIPATIPGYMIPSGWYVRICARPSYGWNALGGWMCPSTGILVP